MVHVKFCIAVDGPYFETIINEGDTFEEVQKKKAFEVLNIKPIEFDLNGTIFNSEAGTKSIGEVLTIYEGVTIVARENIQNTNWKAGKPKKEKVTVKEMNLVPKPPTTPTVRDIAPTRITPSPKVLIISIVFSSLTAVCFILSIILALFLVGKVSELASYAVAIPIFVIPLIIIPINAFHNRLCCSRQNLCCGRPKMLAFFILLYICYSLFVVIGIALIISGLSSFPPPTPIIVTGALALVAVICSSMPIFISNLCPCD